MTRLTKSWLGKIAVGFVGLILLCCVAGVIFGPQQTTSTGVNGQPTIVDESIKNSQVKTSDEQAAEPTEATEQASQHQPTEHFDRSNWEMLISAPEDHEGATVDIVGRVFTAPERDGDLLGWQMWADPKNNEWNTLVAMRDANVSIKQDQYVRVRGTVRGAHEGTNAFGGTIRAAVIEAEHVEIVDALAAASPAERSVDVQAEQIQHELHVTVEKVEFAEDETRLFVKVANNSSNEASFYSFSAKAVQGTSQYEPEYTGDYPKVQSDLLPGIESAGVIVFPAMSSDQPTKFFLEARTSDYSLDFEPYMFEIEAN